jgi:hypothetical protein
MDITSLEMTPIFPNNKNTPTKMVVTAMIMVVVLGSIQSFCHWATPQVNLIMVTLPKKINP